MPRQEPTAVTLLLAAAVLLALSAELAAETTDALAPSWVPELSQAARELSSAEPAIRLEAARKIASLGGRLRTGQDVRALAELLARPRTTTVEAYRALILEVWGQVPNWQGPDPMWVQRPEPPLPPRLPGAPRPRRPPPHDPEKVDWLAALAELELPPPGTAAPDLGAPPPPPTPRRARPGERLPPPLPPLPSVSAIVDGPRARADALEIVGLLRALGATHRAEAVEPLFSMAFELDGVFRDECGRQIRALGDVAVPRLIRLRYDRSEGRVAKHRRYAAYQLDRMDRARPLTTLKAAPDDQLRAELLQAYGDVRSLDAVEAVLRYLDDSSQRVRRTARRAWLGYVGGPPPPPAPRRKRKLMGGREEEEEKPDYLTYREIAELALSREIGALRGEPPSEPIDTMALTRELFAYYDGKRDAQADAALTEALALAERGELEAAVARVSIVLAEQPGYRRRAEIAPLLERQGQALLQAGNQAAAARLLRQAAVLTAEPAASERIASLLSRCAEGRTRARSGAPLLIGPRWTARTTAWAAGSLGSLAFLLALAWYRAGRSVVGGRRDG